MNLPSKRYFELVKTYEDFVLFWSSGMGWEWEPDGPNSWEEHLKMVELQKNEE